VIILTSNLATDLLTEAASPDRPLPPFEDLTALVKPTLSAYFKPALLARMTVVPFVPIRPEALREIARQKLEAVARRARETHRIELEIGPEVVEAVAARCREVESGARNVDHILRGSILPMVSREILRALAENETLTSLRLTLDETGAIVCTKAESP
jgi:type VI secretion system protein VasG